MNRNFCLFRNSKLLYKYELLLCIKQMEQDALKCKNNYLVQHSSLKKLPVTLVEALTVYGKQSAKRYCTISINHYEINTPDYSFVLFLHSKGWIFYAKLNEWGNSFR